MKSSDFYKMNINLSGLDSAVILNRAADLVERGWTQHAGARNDHNKPTVLLAPDATRFCAVGAVLRSMIEYLIDTGVMPEHARHHNPVNHPVINNALDFVLSPIENGDPDLIEETQRWLVCNGQITGAFHLQSYVAAWNDRLADQSRVVAMLRRAAQHAACDTARHVCAWATAETAWPAVVIHDNGFVSASDLLKQTRSRRVDPDLSSLFPSLYQPTPLKGPPHDPVPEPHSLKELIDA